MNLGAQVEAVAAVLTGGLAVFGLLVGSFLNVVIARVPHGESIVSPRSKCPKCGHQLAWFENIPVFSWLVLRGRCRACRAPISPRYVVVEMLTSLLYLACLQRFGWTWELLPAVVLVSLLIPLAFIDLEHWLLPFEITIPGIAAGWLTAIPLGVPALVDSGIGAAAGFGAFWLLEIVGERIFKKEALGGGDKFLLALIGAFLSWRGLLPVVFLSSLQGAIVGSVLLLIHGRAGPAPTEPGSAEVEAGGEAPKGERDVSVVPPASAAPTANVEEDDWVPGPTNIPFGPWLSLAAMEVMLLAPILSRLLPSTLSWIVAGPGTR